MAETNLREAIADIEVVGKVSEVKLQEVIEKGEKRIEGSVVVKTSPTNFITLRVRVNEKTKDGKDNGFYPGLLTVMNNYLSIAKDGDEAADWVRTKGRVRPFRSNNSGQELMSFSTNSFTRITDSDHIEPRAEVDVEVYVDQVSPEVDREGIETGRAIVKGWLPTYTGIEPILLIAPKDISDFIISTFTSGQTARFFADAVNERIEIVKEIPVMIGKPKVERHTDYRNELVITGITEIYEEGVTETQPYNSDAIRIAIEERNQRIAEERNRGNGIARTQTRPSAAAHGRTVNF